MLHFIEIIIALSIIVVVVPQTPTENVVLRKLVESRLFVSYNAAKQFLIWTTWSLTFLFLIVLILLNLKFF